VASPFFIGAKTFLAHESDARSDEICRAIEFEDTFVKLRPSDGAQVFFFRGGLDGPSGLLDVIMQANNGGNDQNEADSLNRSSSTRRITIVNACIVT